MALTVAGLTPIRVASSLSDKPFATLIWRTEPANSNSLTGPLLFILTRSAYLNKIEKKLVAPDLSCLYSGRIKIQHENTQTEPTDRSLLHFRHFLRDTETDLYLPEG